MAQIPTVVERLERPSRRRLLRSSGAAGGVLFAGCLGANVRALNAVKRLSVDGRAHESPQAIRFSGSHPGSLAYVERCPDGVSLAALFNGRHPQLTPSSAIIQQLEAALEQIEEWP
ncbi:hypothetical protein [Natronorubrum halophilum]|uniref:hypothetical protein n=1 Tax=Natronorubrum halophilum TaxID=1702106 RepID=UPI0010C179F2|nr:hypothetical protein [Natronorubrum halophilum]